MQQGYILLLENVLFYAEEKANDEQFARRIVELSQAELFVQDAFGVVHRSHATTDAITRLLPSVAGLLLTEEVSKISAAIEAPDKPMMAIVGGSKIADKIDILRAFMKKADVVAIGGAMSNTFLVAQGVDVGSSLYDENELAAAHELMDMARSEAQQRDFLFYIPQDGVVAKSTDAAQNTRIVDWDAHVIAEIEAYPKKPVAKTAHIADDEEILDIGPVSGSFISGLSQMCQTVIWNGTMGVSEVAPLRGSTGPFAHGTEMIVEALIGKYGLRPFSLVGGGDTAAYLEKKKIVDMFSHVSTGGGASLELMAGKKLPGVEALLEK